MRHFFRVFLCLGLIAGSAYAQGPARNAPKYLDLPYPPNTRSALSPMTRLRYERAVADHVDTWKMLESSYSCPKTNQLFKRIYDRIVKANDLETYFQLEGIKMNLIILCPNGFNEDAFAATGLIVMSAAFAKNFMMTEDEIALMLSHELSHVIRAWDMRLFSYPFMAQPHFTKLEEDQADENAMVMVSNAGYDPHSSYMYQEKYARSLPPEEAVYEPTHSAPILRPILAQRYIMRNRLQKKSATLFSDEVRDIFRTEVGLQ